MRALKRIHSEYVNPHWRERSVKLCNNSKMDFCTASRISKGNSMNLPRGVTTRYVSQVFEFLYLLSKQSADPLIRNDWGETAYDVAAAVFEIWICEVIYLHFTIKLRMSHNFCAGPSASRSRKMAIHYCPIRSSIRTYYCTYYNI